MLNRVNSVRGLTYQGESGPRTADGVVYAQQAFIRVRWGWITMLITQLVLTSLFLVSVVIETWIARVQILKGSTLATMCALDGAARNIVGGISDLNAMKERARTLGLVLEQGGNSGDTL